MRKNTTNTSATQSQLVECVKQSLHGQSLGLHDFIAILKARSESIDFTLWGISSHNLGANYKNDLVTLYTDCAGLAWNACLFMIW